MITPVLDWSNHAEKFSFAITGLKYILECIKTVISHFTVYAAFLIE